MKKPLAVKHTLRLAASCLVIFSASLAGCQTAPSIAPSSLLPTAPKNSSAITTGTEHFAFKTLSSSAWVSDRFTGQHARQFHETELHFGVHQTHKEGGLDVGLSERASIAAPVIQAKTELRVCSKYKINLSGEGRWWAGPKISINWQGDEAAKQNGDDWYENYIVEIASSTPDELHEIIMGDYFKGEELAPLQLAGSTYRNYKIRFHSWWQFWSVRQDYRASGTLEIEPILDLWIENGLPKNRIFDGVKANIETYGPIKGRGRLTMAETQNPSEALSCE